MKDLVALENNTPITTSKIVADIFGKRHDHVVRDIEQTIQQMAAVSQTPNLGTANMFSKTSYQPEEGGRKYPMYTMTRDGFSLLAMGFTGKKALKFKLDFIKAFNRMEQKLKELSSAKAPAIDDPRWTETRQLGKKTRKSLTAAIKALDEYFKARVKVYPAGYLYGHLTNIIQNALSIKKGGRDLASIKKLNQLDQAEDIAGNIILQAIDKNSILSLAEIDAKILLQLKQLNQLLCGQLFLPLEA